MALVVLVERHEEMRRLYRTWHTHHDHDVVNCPGVVDGEVGRLRCLLLEGATCPFVGQASVAVYDPWSRQGPADHEDVEVIRAIRQSHPGARVFIAGGWQWLPEGIRQLMLEDSGILLAPFNPPELATQLSRLDKAC